MENYGLKGLGVTLWQRVVLSYKTTLIALGLIIADVVVNHFLAVPLPAWAHSIVVVLATMLALIKEQNRAATSALQPPAPRGFARVRLLMLLALACLLMSLSSCAFFRPIQPKLISCAATPAMSIVVGVAEALASDPGSWQVKLDGLAVQAGIDAVVCAVQVIIAQLEAPAPSGGAGQVCVEAPCPVAPEVKLARGYHYLATRGLRPASP